VSWKKRPKYFRNIFDTARAIPIGFGTNFSWVNLLQNDTNVSHLAWIMSLHYLVKLEMLISHVLPLSCYSKKLQNWSHLNCGLQISRFEFSWLLLRLLQKKVYKTRNTDLDELKQPLRKEWAKLDHVIITATLSDGVVDSSRSVMRVLSVKAVICGFYQWISRWKKQIYFVIY